MDSSVMDIKTERLTLVPLQRLKTYLRESIKQAEENHGRN